MSQNNMGHRNMGMEFEDNCRKGSKSGGGYTISWANLGYTVKQGKTEKEILSRLYGIVHPGSLVAVLGASGAGKSSFLDALAGRKPFSDVSGIVAINGRTNLPMKHVSRYCVQEEALFGNLTVFETLMYAADFNLPKSTPRKEKERMVKELLNEFGLARARNTIIGTPLRKGCSGGQVRRVSVATQILGLNEGILFLDEPTSGLDSVAARSIISGVASLTKKQNLAVIATIHQPSTETFNLFTHVLILGQGRTIYFGPREEAVDYFGSIGSPIPVHANPSDVYLEMTNIDFETDKHGEMKDRVIGFANTFAKSETHSRIISDIKKIRGSPLPSPKGSLGYTNGFAYQTLTLLSRSFLNAVKNPLAWWMRVAMYIALAVLMGTTWFRMGSGQNTVQDRLSALVFGAAFMSFMNVAGIPAFLEERLVLMRELGNGLYGVESYILSNLIVSIPFLFIITMSFSGIAYYAMGLQVSTEKFCTFASILFMSLMIAEAQTTMVSVAIPVFVGALAVSAFINGLWLIMQGFFVQKKNIPAFWFYSFHQIDYQKYVLELLIDNEFRGLNFDCASKPGGGAGCVCIIPPSSNSTNTCSFRGEDVLDFFDYADISYTNYLLILCAIFVFYKVVTVIVLKLQTSNRKKGKVWDPERSVVVAIMAPRIFQMSASQLDNPNLPPIQAVSNDYSGTRL